MTDRQFKRVSRRDFVQLAALTAAASAALTACGGLSAPVTAPAGGTPTVAGAPVTTAPAASAVANPSAAIEAATAFIQQGGAALVGIDYAKIDILSEQVAPNVYALTGSSGVDPGHPEAAGGRVGVLTGPEGVLVVDAQYAPLTDKVVAYQ